MDTDDSLTLGKIDVSVVTNSDYIMEKMLDHGNLANISGDTLTPVKTKSRPSIRLTHESSKITFGYVKRENTPLTPLAETFFNLYQTGINRRIKNKKRLISYMHNINI